MRFKVPKHNDSRIIKKFLLIPIEIRNEVRWLEHVVIEQRYDEYRGKWVNMKWVE